MSSNDSDSEPSSSDDATLPPRLRGAGSSFERQLIESGELDVPSASARQRAHEAAQGALDREREQRQERERRRRSWAGLAFALAAAAAVAVVGLAGLWTQRQRQLAVIPEPEPVARATGKAGLPTTEAPSPPRESPTPKPVLPACRKVVVGTGLDPLIEDFEDGNARLLIRDGREGSWMAEGDRSGKQTPAPNYAVFPVRSVEKGHAGQFALRLRTERLTVSGAGLYADLVPGQCYDASAYAGIEFWAKGSGRIVFGPGVVDIIEKKWGGVCERDCYDRHLASVALTPEWKRYSARWDEFSQAGWGHQVPLDPARLNSIGFAVQVPDTPIDFWIDDIQFVKR